MKVISFINMKGGVAKTTLAVNLADCLNRRHAKRVLVIDVDPQFNCTQCLMAPDDYIAHRAASKDTILEVFDRTRLLVGAATAAKVSKARSLEDIKPVSYRAGMDFLPGNLELYRLEMAPGEGRENRLRSYLNAIEAAKSYDFVIVDTPPTPSVWMTSALIASDCFVIPVRPDPLSLTGIDLLRSIVADRKENFGLSLDCLGVVLTMTRQGTNVLADARRFLGNDKYWGPRLFGTQIPGRVKVAEYQLERLFMLDMPDNDIALAITQFTNEFNTRMAAREKVI